MLKMSGSRRGLEAAFRASAAAATVALKPSKSVATSLNRSRAFSSSPECKHSLG